MEVVAPRPASAIHSILWAKQAVSDDAEVQSIRRAEAVGAVSLAERVTHRVTSTAEVRRGPASSPVRSGGWVNGVDEEEDSDYVVDEDEDASDADSDLDEEDREEVRRELQWLLKDQREDDALNQSGSVATPPRSTCVDKGFQSQFWRTPPTVSRSARRSINFGDATVVNKASTSVKRKMKLKGMKTASAREEGERRRRHHGRRVASSRSRARGGKYRHDALETGEWDGTVSLGVLVLFMVLALASQAYALAQEQSDSAS